MVSAILLSSWLTDVVDSLIIGGQVDNFFCRFRHVKHSSHNRRNALEGMLDTSQG